MDGLRLDREIVMGSSTEIVMQQTEFFIAQHRHLWTLKKT